MKSLEVRVYPISTAYQSLMQLAFKDDTQLVAILYRTHNSLQSSTKVSSLYAFDALARAARSVVNKRGITDDVNLAKGSAATFLLKIEGVLDGLFRDMVSLDNSEAKVSNQSMLFHENESALGVWLCLRFRRNLAVQGPLPLLT